VAKFVVDKDNVETFHVTLQEEDEGDVAIRINGKRVAFFRGVDKKLYLVCGLGQHNLGLPLTKAGELQTV
jgi:hypothetical protein